MQRRVRRLELRQQRRARLFARLRSACSVALRTLAFVAVLAACGFGAHYAYRAVLRSTYFDVATIRFSGTRNALPSELMPLAEGAKGHSIFRTDGAALAANVARHPWVREAKVQRVLPRTLLIDVREQSAAAVLVLERLYLLNDAGEPFKAATPQEAEGLVLVTGLSREQLRQRGPQAQALLGNALKALASYHSGPRPRLSELHLGRDGELTFFLRKSGTALRFGKTLSPDRLAQLDAVWSALGPAKARAQALFLDHEVRTNRVVVRMSPTAAH